MRALATTMGFSNPDFDKHQVRFIVDPIEYASGV
jgi:hypothetical protein